MSSFASRTQKTIPNPYDEGKTFTIRRLSGAPVEQAQAQHLIGLVGGKNPRGWAGRFQRVLEQGLATAEDALKAIRDPLAGYDRLTVAKLGIVGWNYTGNDGQALTVTADAIEDLDDETLEHVAIEIMRITKPALFLTADEAEAARKNG